MPDNPLKRLVVVEYEITEDGTEEYKKGERFSHFFDPDSRAFYRPKPGFTVVVTDDVPNGDLRHNFDLVIGESSLEMKEVSR